MFTLSKEQKIANLEEIKKQIETKIQNLQTQIQDIDKKISKLSSSKSFT